MGQPGTVRPRDYNVRSQASCVPAPALFCVAIDWILRHIQIRPGIAVGPHSFTDLVYADYTTFLVDSSPSGAFSCLSSFNETTSVFGLHTSWPKTKIQNLGSGPETPGITVDGTPVDAVSNLVYLGSLQSSGGTAPPTSVDV